MGVNRESFDLSKFPDSPCAQEMLESVTKGFYDSSYVAKWLYQVMGLEYDEAKKLAEELPYQWFPETATWGLMYHEIKWNLPVRTQLSYEERRKYIYEKRDERYPMTPFRMEKLLSELTNLEIRIEDCNDAGIYGYEAEHPNRFRLVVVAVESPPQEEMTRLRSKLAKIKQTHTVFDIIVRRNMWYLDGTYGLDGEQVLNAEEQMD